MALYSRRRNMIYDYVIYVLTQYADPYISWSFPLPGRSCQDTAKEVEETWCRQFLAEQVLRNLAICDNFQNWVAPLI
jgi:hypothetical protein